MQPSPPTIASVLYVETGTQRFPPDLPWTRRVWVPWPGMHVSQSLSVIMMNTFDLYALVKQQAGFAMPSKGEDARRGRGSSVPTQLWPPQPF